jgi:glycosyltransferase involved in cell wall biosynthesis
MLANAPAARRRNADGPKAKASRAADVVMLLENNPYPQDVRVRAEAESLAAHGYRVRVIAPRAPGQPRRERLADVDVRRFRGSDAGGGGTAAFVREYAVAAVALHLQALRALLEGARVLHLHNPPDILFAAGALFRLCRRKVIFDHHDLFPETIAVKFDSNAAVALARLTERLTFAVANRVIATNESYAEIARSRGGKSEAEVAVVRNAPPREWLARPARMRPGALQPVKLVYLGAMSTQDGVDALPRVLAALRARGQEATLTIIGDGDARAQLAVQLRKDGLLDAVDVTGWISFADVPDLLDAADICLDPAPPTDVNNRSTMIKIAEYLALGKPVVAYDLLETRRTAGDAALLIPAGDEERFTDAILTLARDERLRVRLSTAARERAAELVWPKSEEALLAVYEAVRPRGGDARGIEPGRTR